MNFSSKIIFIVIFIKVFLLLNPHGIIYGQDFLKINFHQDSMIKQITNRYLLRDTMRGVIDKLSNLSNKCSYNTELNDSYIFSISRNLSDLNSDYSKLNSFCININDTIPSFCLPSGISIISRMLNWLLLSYSIPLHINHLYTIGKNQFFEDKYTQSFHTLNKALKLISILNQKIIDSRLSHQIAEIYYLMGNNYLIQGKFMIGLSFLHHSQEIYDSCQIFDQILKYKIQVNIGNGYAFLEDWKKSLEHYIQAYSTTLLIKDSNNNLRHADLCNNIAGVFEEIGSVSECIAFLDQSKKFYIQSNSADLSVLSTYYNNIGNLLLRENKFSDAFNNFLLSSDILLSSNNNNATDFSFYLTNIGIALEGLNKYKEALSYYYSALQQRISLFGKMHYKTAKSYYNLSRCYYKMHKYDSSYFFIVQALFSNNICSNDTILDSICAQIKLNVCLSNVQYLHLLSHIYLKINNNNIEYCSRRALQYSKEAAEMLLKYIILVSYNERARTNILNRNYSIIEHYFYLTDSLNNNPSEKTKQLFKILCLFKCFNFNIEFFNQNFLKSSFNNFNVSNYSLEALLPFESDTCNYALSTASKKIRKMLSSSLNDIKTSPFLTDDINDIINESMQSLPNYLLLDSVMHHYFDSTSLRLEYLVLSKFLLVFIVAKDTIFIKKINFSKSRLISLINRFLYSIRTFEHSEFSTLSHELYQLLIEPINIDTNKYHKLIICPDSYLYNIPFEAIMTKKEVNSSNCFLRNTFLINDFEISYSLTSTIIKYYSQCNVSKKITDSSFLGISSFDILDDNQNMPINNSINDTPIKDDHSIFSSIIENPHLFFPSLTYSNNEIEEINNIIQAHDIHTRVDIFHNTKKEQFININKKRRIIHIASHYYSDYDDCQLGGLAFNSDYYYTHNKNSILHHSKILANYELKNLDLHSDLITLSSCETSLGEISYCDYPINLPRILFLKGNMNVLSSLWSISDYHTMLLMKYFYYNVFANNMTYNQALRKAKIEMISNNATRFPLYWAGFIITFN